MTLFDVSAIRLELGKLLGVPVDVVTPNALPDEFRASVLAEVAPCMTSDQPARGPDIPHNSGAISSVVRKQAG